MVVPIFVIISLQSTIAALAEHSIAVLKWKTISFILLCMLLFSCNKAYLDERPNKALVVPTELKDFQALLDANTTMNTFSPGLGELGSDNYYFDLTTYQSRSPFERSSHIWEQDITYASLNDWSAPYQQVYYSNVALDGLKKIDLTVTNQDEWNNIKGSALFYRANAFYNLIQIFSKPYNSATASSDLGIVLKLSSDIQEQYSRSTVQQTYDKIISDLLESIPLLPAIPLYKTRPSKPAAHALLARAYLDMGNFDAALQNTESGLALYNTLIDFNSVNAALARPLVRFNNEVIFHHEMASYSAFTAPRSITDSTLYKLYDNNDLRKTVFFGNSNGVIFFKCNYTGAPQYFSGISSNELYLIAAESAARNGNANAATDYLNALLVTRWKAGTFIPYTASDAGEALQKVVQERRKELPFRGLRWMDLRRLNQEAQFATTLTRVIDGQSYTLPPNDSRYCWPIPENEIQVSGITQNLR